MLPHNKYISKRWRCRICGFESESYNDIVNHIEEKHKSKLKQKVK